MQRRNLAKKNNDKYNVDRKFCEIFCGFADNLDEAQKQVPAEKKGPRRFTSFSQIHAFISESFPCMILTLIILEFNLVFFPCIPFRVSSGTLSHFMPSNPGLGTARQDHIKTITYSAVAKCNSQQTLQ